MKQPEIQVGIMSGKSISFSLEGKFNLNNTDKELSGVHLISLEDDKVNVYLLDDEEKHLITSQDVNLSGDNVSFDGQSFELTVSPGGSESCFELRDVTIGIDFHWERKENQRFSGSLKFIVENDCLTAINVLSLEDYLISVISSEMSATSSTELLKAHAVISRSWLLAQIEKGKALQEQSMKYSSLVETDDEYIRWYDREDHANFDVCADDHCQRYQGITKASTQTVVDAVESTSGELLMYNSEICDARFSKCCGGMVEEFQHVWEPRKHDYLKKVVDNNSAPVGYDLDLTKEEAADKWIRTSPEAFCNTNEKDVLSQVLNDYDQETADFYRWKVEYTQDELSTLIKKRSDIDFGDILDLIPMERGASGRLIRLKIVGSLRTMIIGKELQIRKTLSESHLYSSAFVVDKENGTDGVPSKFTLTGAGWGHGVGLCQIGAAVMGARGYSYNEILLHYFPGADIIKKY
ncbi:SpoIID/LytB domain-containing protein [Puteibacter caeruleilacunae]|nr:SpoIID/LytB domain-containing protein [Puteibacter caeruleilacunae]